MPDWVTVLSLFCGRACKLDGEEAGGQGTSTITPCQTGLRFYSYFVVEPVNWVEEKLLGGYWYNHTTPVRVIVLFLFCGRACELGGGKAAGRVMV